MVSIAVDVGRATSKRLSRIHIYIGVLPLVLLTVCVVLLTVSPLIAVVAAAFRDAPPGQPGNWTLQGFVTILSEPQYLAVIWTSVWLALLRATLATIIAITIAWILARTDCPFRSHLEYLIFLSFFFPVLGKVLGWALLASPNAGYINQLLRLLPIWSGDTGPFNIYSYEGVIIVSVLGWSTTLIMFLLPAFRAMDAALEESAFVSGASAWRTFAMITAPLMKPAIEAAFILALVRLFSSFETELFLGSRAGIYVFTNKIFDLMSILPPDYSTAFALAFLLLLVTFTLVVFNWIVIGGTSYTTVTGRSYSARPMRLGRLRWIAFSLVAIYLLFCLVLPVLVLIHTSFIKTAGLNVLSPESYTLRNWNTILSLEIPRRALINSLIMSVVATTIGMIIYSLVAYIVARTDYKGRKILDLAAWLPWGVPLLVLGMGVLWAVMLSPLAVLYGSLAIMIIAHIVRGFPVETRIMASTLIQIGRELEEAARIHGASWLTSFSHILIPLVKNGFITGWVIGFSVSFSDLALVAFLYGPESTILPTLFFSLWRNGQLERASVAALIMAAIVLTIVTIVRRVSRTGLTAAD